MSVTVGGVLMQHASPDMIKDTNANEAPRHDGMAPSRLLSPKSEKSRVRVSAMGNCRSAMGNCRSAMRNCKSSGITLLNGFRKIQECKCKCNSSAN